MQKTRRRTCLHTAVFACVLYFENLQENLQEELLAPETCL